MRRNGKFIVVEGIDGSGKKTQVELLAEALKEAGLSVEVIAFPQYEGTFFGRMVGDYLAGKFGEIGDVSPYFASLLYAGDRWQAAGKIRRWLNEGKIVIADRYAGSNAAHQAANLPERKRRRFIAWLDTLEFKIFRIPREDLTILLSVPPEISQELVGRRRVRKHPKGVAQDILERNLEHLRRTSMLYQQLAAEQANWVVINCADGKDGIRSIEEIHRDVLAILKSRLGIEV